MQDFSSQAWYLYLTDWQKKLVETSLQLLDRELNSEQENHFADYSFIVFPMAKAYEGFLKKYFYDFNLIDEHTFRGKKFRIGRALNPDISTNHRDEHWIFDDVEQLCGTALAREMWDTWIECRNRIFHYFADEKDKATLAEAEQKIEKMAQAMTDAFLCMNEVNNN